MPQPTINDISFENLIFDDDVAKQVEANLITSKLTELGKAPAADPIIEQAVAPVIDTLDTTTLEEAQTDDATDDENPITTMLLTALGVDVEGEFDDTAEGVNRLLTSAIPKLVEARLKETIGAHPILEQFATYVMDGGDPNNFLSVQLPETDYEQLQLNNNDVATQEKLVRTFFARQGLGSDKITSLVNSFKDTNLLFSQAETALEVLTRQQKIEQYTLLSDQASIRESEQTENLRVWKDIEYKVTTGKIQEVTIPIAERAAFLSYISQTVDKAGNTQADLDADKADLDMNLAMDYMRFKKMDLSSLVAGGVKTKMSNDKQEKLRLKDKTSGDPMRSKVIKNPISALEGLTNALDFKFT